MQLDPHKTLDLGGISLKFKFKKKYLMLYFFGSEVLNSI